MCRECVESVKRVCRECVESVQRVCIECVESVYLVLTHIFETKNQAVISYEVICLIINIVIVDMCDLFP